VNNDHKAMLMRGANVGLERFASLWRRSMAVPPSPDGASMHAELCRLYDAPHRRFHTLGHVSDCIAWLDVVAPLVRDPDALELALWFHDAVYAAGSDANERRSAEMFASAASGARPHLCRRVCGLIMATRHTGAAQGNDRQFMVDIDLAGFGAPWKEFMAKGDELRAEFASQPDSDYYRGQIQFLCRLQRRKHFFCTDYFRERYEKIAQSNLRRLVKLRIQQGYQPAVA